MRDRDGLAGTFARKNHILSDYLLDNCIAVLSFLHLFHLKIGFLRKVWRALC